MGLIEYSLLGFIFGSVLGRLSFYFEKRKEKQTSPENDPNTLIWFFAVPWMLIFPYIISYLSSSTWLSEYVNEITLEDPREILGSFFIWFYALAWIWSGPVIFVQCFIYPIFLILGYSGSLIDKFLTITKIYKVSRFIGIDLKNNKFISLSVSLLVYIGLMIFGLYVASVMIGFDL